MKNRLTVFGLIGVLLLALVSSCAFAENNLLSNGSFEQLDGTGSPVDWYENAYYDEVGYSRLSISSDYAHSGSYSVMVENASPNDARYICSVSVQPSSTYKLSGYVLVDHMDPEGNGANLAIEDVYAFSERVFDTNGEWQYIEWYGKTGAKQKSVTIGVRVGGYGSESTGKAYFDDISLEKVNVLPDGISASAWYTDRAAAVEKAPTSDETKHIWNSIAFLGIGLLFVTAILWLPYYLKKLDFLKNMDHTIHFMILIAVGVMVRIILAVSVSGYQVDIGCFQAWSLRMAERGPAGFYSPDYFCDYPPGYMLLLWPVGLILRGAMAAGNTGLSLLLVKCVPILCDLIIAFLLFFYGKKTIGDKKAAFVGSLYLLNPAVLVNGAAWGQVDSVLAMMLILCAVYAIEQRWLVALPLYILSILIKPQALLFAPVAGIWLLLCLFGKQGRSLKEQWKALLGGLGIGVIAAAIVIVPFSIHQEKPIGWLIELYQKTLSSYSYATLNTANLYYLFAANWRPLISSVTPTLPLLTCLTAAGLSAYLLIKTRKEEASLLTSHNGRLGLLTAVLAVLQLLFTGLSFATGWVDYSIYGYTMMIFGFTAAILMMLNDQKAGHLPFYLALALILVYMVGVKIHERYLFAALPLLLLAYLRGRDSRVLLLMAGLSATTFINTAIVLDNSILFGSTMGHLNDDTLLLNVLLCIANMCLLAYALWIGYTGLRENSSISVLEGRLVSGVQDTASASANKANADEQPVNHIPSSYETMLFKPRDHRMHLTGKDWLIMGVVTVLYSVLTLTNLGSFVAPQHGWISSSASETITFELEESTDFSVLYYAGVSNYSFSISVSEDGENWSANFPCEMREGLCYRWNYALQSEQGENGPIYAGNRTDGILWLRGKYLRLNAERAGLNLFEIVVRDQEGTNLTTQVVDHQGANPSILDAETLPEYLIDEQNTCVGEPGWFTGTYFDEIYHARTAYEHLHGQRPYETTHPPLGKLLIAVGVAIFGMTPFGWRFAGALIGALMLPAIYLLARQLFRRRDLAAFSMCAFALDLMHFTQTRIATIDSFPVFFILLSYWFMVRYMQTDFFAVGEDEQPVLFTKAFWKSLIPLALSGLMMGFSIASKWIGIYSAAGLAILFFTTVYRQYRVGNIAFNYPVDEASDTMDEQARKRVLGAQDHALNRIFITCGFCVLFFILVPCVVYYLSYIPYLAPGGRVTIQRVIDAQVGMLDYHSTPGLGMDHPFQSPWWQWPFILKPMWFAQDNFEPAGYASTIMCMGNPWVFYIGAICMAAVLIALFARHLQLKDRKLSLRQGDGNLAVYTLVIAFLSQYLPWVLVPRSMYIYHYFASVPFIIMATAWVFGLLAPKRQKLMRLMMAVYLIGALVFFVMFFPYASGLLTPTSWLDAMKWFPRLYY